MAHPTYRSLIDAVCKAAGVADSAAVHQHGHLRVNGVEFSLLHAAHPGADLLLVYADFGPLPQQQREAVLQRLLEVNLFLFGGEGPGFSFNPESGHVLLMAQLRLAQANAATVLAALRSMALFAKGWHGDHFLGEAPVRRPAAGGSVLSTGGAFGTPFHRAT